jgi:hypothetical protein
MKPAGRWLQNLLKPCPLGLNTRQRVSERGEGGAKFTSLFEKADKEKGVSANNLF